MSIFPMFDVHERNVRAHRLFVTDSCQTNGAPFRRLVQTMYNDIFCKTDILLYRNSVIKNHIL